MPEPKPEGADIDFIKFFEYVEPTTILLGGVVLLLLFWNLAQRNRAARFLQRNKRLGQRGEEKARRLLRDAGYVIVEEQAGASYPLIVDDKVVDVQIRADFMVERENKLWVAEAKAGLESGRVTQRQTRRQLLEYTLAFDVEGILLVDVARDSIIRVRFPHVGPR